MTIYDVNKCNSLKKLPGHTNYVFCTNYNPRSRMTVSGSFDESVRLFDFAPVELYECFLRMLTPSRPYSFLAMVLCLCHHHTTPHSDLGFCLGQFVEEVKTEVSFVKISLKGKYVLAGILDNCSWLWDVRS